MLNTKRAFCTGLVLLILLLYLWAIVSCGLKDGIIGLSIYLAFYVFCAFCIYSRKSVEAIKSVSRLDLIASIAICISIGVFYILFIGGERWIYSHDYGGYWQSTINTYTRLSTSISQTFEFVFNSINDLDYNNLLPLILATPLNMLGNSRAAYIGLIYFSFVVPIAYVLYFCIKTLRQEKGEGIPLWLVCLFICTFPIFLGAILDGMFDASYALLMAICFLMYFQHDQDCRYDFKYSCSLGLCITMILLLRRTAAFWVVGFATAVISIFIFRLIKSDKKSQLLKAFFIDYGISLVIVSIILLAFFPGMIERGLHNDFSFSYSAYNAEKSLIDHAFEIVAVTGGIVTFICIVGIGLAMYLKCGLEQFAMLFITSFVAANLFWRIQDMGVHHYNIIAVQIGLWVLISISLLLQWFEKFQAKVRRIASNFLLVFVALLSIASCLNMTLVEDQHKYSGLLSLIKHPQLQRDDLQAVYELLDSIPAGSSVYVASSSDVFNISIVVNGFLQRGIDVPFAVHSAEVDLRDGFNSAFFEDDYVITCTPPQTHLKPGSQLVVEDLSTAFSENLYDIDSYYELVGSFDLINGVKASLYKKTSDFTNEEIQQIAEHFDSLYPDNKDLFYDRIITAEQ